MTNLPKTCPHCRGVNSADAVHCGHCGKPLAVLESPAERTLPLSGSNKLTAELRKRIPVDIFASNTGERHRAVPVETLFIYKKQLTIGRTPKSDICLPHASVSRTHALLEKTPDGLRLQDVSSVNGIYVNGRRLTEPVVLRENERVGIGPFLFCLSGGVMHALDSSQSLRLEARQLEKTVWTDGGKQRKLLDNINLAVEPGEFVSLLGPSGSGKSTLMDCLNGRRPATGGRVLANGEDFYRHFDSFRQSLGYVPQRDIVHTGLTVRRALYYTARLRLPTDTDRSELTTRIEEVLQLMELTPHQDTLVGNLSGGQIKRVSLGAELLARPCLLYIDEATSGLDAGTEARMMRLFRDLANEGKTVFCITHNVDNVDLCNLILVLSQGKLVYYGPPSEARSYFKVGRVSEIYDRLAGRSPDAWETEFKLCSLHKAFVADRLASAPEGSLMLQTPETAELLKAALEAKQSFGPKSRSDSSITGGAARPAERVHRQITNQFFVLTARYAELMWRDARTLRLLLLQAPMVALFVLFGFMNRPYQQKVLAPRLMTESERQQLTTAVHLAKASKSGIEAATPMLKQFILDPGQAADLQQGLTRSDDLLRKAEAMLEAEGPVMPDRIIVNPRYTYMLLFVLVLAVLWFGCNNAAKEIVKEEAIYSRERSVNLHITPYLASKFLVLGVISAVQVFLLMAVMYGVLFGLHAAVGWDAPAVEYMLDFPAQYGVLLLLAMVGVALGLLISACVANPDRASTLLPYVLIPQMILAGGIIPIRDGPLYWLACSACPAYWGFRGIRANAEALPADFPGHMDYADNPWLAVMLLALQTAVLLLATAWFLRGRDVRKA